MMGGFLLRGILIGLLFGVPVGAVGVMTVERTWNYGIRAGLLAGLPYVSKIGGFVLRACLKIHSHQMHAPLCGIFGPHSVNAAHYASLIRAQSSTNWDPHLTESNFQTRSKKQMNL